MKATLEFTLPEESEAHEEALQGREAFSALRDIRRIARSYLKHGHDGTVERADRLIEDIMEIACQTFGGVEV